MVTTAETFCQLVSAKLPFDCSAKVPYEFVGQDRTIPVCEGTMVNTGAGNNPYTFSLFEKVARYTLPLATVGGTNFAKLPTESRPLSFSEFQSSCETFCAFNARSMPGRTC